MPVVPGVVILDEILRMAHELLSPEASVAGMDNVKFMHPLLPQQRFTIKLTDERPDRWRFECWRQEQHIVTGKLLLVRGT